MATPNIIILIIIIIIFSQPPLSASFQSFVHTIERECLFYSQQIKEAQIKVSWLLVPVNNVYRGDEKYMYIPV